MPIRERARMNATTSAISQAASTTSVSESGLSAVVSSSVVVGGGVRAGPPGGFGAPGVDGRGAGAGLGGRDGAGVGGARANGGSSPTMALGEMLRSWFLLPLPSSCSVRMCHGDPETSEAPSRGPPFFVSQYADWARWPPQARSTAGPVALNTTSTSAELLPSTGPLCFGLEIETIVPPQIRSRRGAAEYASAPVTARPFATNVSCGNAIELEAGSD